MNFLQLEQTNRTNPLTGEFNYDYRITVSVEDIHEGLIKKIGAKHFVILLAIASHMNAEGEAFPSYERLSELTGISVRSLCNDIPKLLKLEFDGKPLLSREIRGRKSIYNFYVDRSEEDGIENAGHFIAYFMDTYKEVYGEEYVANFARDGKRIKEAFIGKYSSDDLRLMIYTAITNYDRKWANDKFPRPNLGALVSFLGVQALVLGRQKQAVEKETDKLLEADINDYF